MKPAIKILCFTLGTCFAFFLSNGCKKDTSNSPGTISATVGSQNISGTAINQISSTALQGGGGSGYIELDASGITLQLAYGGEDFPRSYPITTYGASYGSWHGWVGVGGNSYGTGGYAGDTGTITITSSNPLIGTFSFIARAINGQAISVTNGTFNIPNP